MPLSLSLHIMGLSLQLWRAGCLAVEGGILGTFSAPPAVPGQGEEDPILDTSYNWVAAHS